MSSESELTTRHDARQRFDLSMRSLALLASATLPILTHLRIPAARFARALSPAQWFDGLCRALVSAKSARMCERAVLTNRPSLDLIPFVLKGREPVGERGEGEADLLSGWPSL